MRSEVLEPKTRPPASRAITIPAATEVGWRRGTRTRTRRKVSEREEEGEGGREKKGRVGRERIENGRENSPSYEREREREEQGRESVRASARATKERTKHETDSPIPNSQPPSTYPVDPMRRHRSSATHKHENKRVSFPLLAKQTRSFRFTKAALPKLLTPLTIAFPSP